MDKPTRRPREMRKRSPGRTPELAGIVARLRAGPARVSARMDAASGFQAIARSGLESLVAAYPQVITRGSPEAVHQTRVAIRRLRAVLGLFRRITQDERAPLLSAGLKAAARALAPARDLHVTIEMIAAPAESAAPDAAAIVAQLEGQRRAATESAAALLAGPPFQQLLLQLAVWIEAGPWVAQRTRAAAGRPLGAFAARALSRRRRKLLRRGNDPAAMTDADRHALRIDVKKLRYASDFLTPVFPGKSARSLQAAFARELKTLQDSLGELNDRAAAARAHSELARLLALEAGSRDRLLRRAQRALQRLHALPDWWGEA